MSPIVTVARLREVLSYDPVSGTLVWIQGGGGRILGNVAGCEGDGKMVLRVDSRLYASHRIAWALYYGDWPPSLIDHRDGDPYNNALTNLRLATSAQNAWNRGKQSNNTSGIKGVSYQRFRRGTKPWTARIKVGGKLHCLGNFHSKEEAGVAYKLAAEELHGSFAKT